MPPSPHKPGFRPRDHCRGLTMPGTWCTIPDRQPEGEPAVADAEATRLPMRKGHGQAGTGPAASAYATPGFHRPNRCNCLLGSWAASLQAPAQPFGTAMPPSPHTPGFRPRDYCRGRTMPGTWSTIPDSRGNTTNRQPNGTTAGGARLPLRCPVCAQVPRPVRTHPHGPGGGWGRGSRITSP